MTPFETYTEYLAIKSHFNGKYDYWKYCGKLSVKQSTFESRKDKIFFQKLAKHSDVKGFLIANLSKDEKGWIRTLAYSEECEKIYKDWLKRQQSLTYMVKQDLGKLDDDFNSNFKVVNNEHPPLLKAYLSGDISLDTISVLLDLTRAIKHWNKEMEYCPVWNEVSGKIMKYTPFIKYDKEAIKKVIVDYYDYK